MNLSSLIRFKYLPIFSLFLLLGCSPKTEPNSEIHLSKALNLLSETLNTEALLKPLLNELQQQNNNIQIQGRALTDAELKRTAEIDQLLQDYKDWDAALVLLPGFEAQIKGHEEHAHQSPATIKAKALYELQQKSRETLGKIKDRAEALLK